MSAAEIVDRHLAEDRRLVESLTREENGCGYPARRFQRPRGPHVPFLTGARWGHRVKSALALANVRIEAQDRAAKSLLGVLDARAAALARGEAR